MCTIIIADEKRLKSILSTPTEDHDTGLELRKRTKDPKVLVIGDDEATKEKTREDQRKRRREPEAEAEAEVAPEIEPDFVEVALTAPFGGSTTSGTPRTTPDLPPRKNKQPKNKNADADDAHENDAVGGSKMDEWAMVKRIPSSEEHEMKEITPHVEPETSVPPTMTQPETIEESGGCGCLPKSECVTGSKWDEQSASDPMKPPSFLPFSLFVCLFCNAFNCCLGLLALFFAVQSESDYRFGAVEEAKKKGRLAVRFAFAGLVLGIVVVLLIVVFFSTGLVNDMIRSQHNPYYYDQGIGAFDFGNFANPGG